MTRREHIEWAKERAIKEMNFYKDPKQGIISIASDLKKHPETNNAALIMLCTAQLMFHQPLSRQDVIEFLDGFR